MKEKIFPPFHHKSVLQFCIRYVSFISCIIQDILTSFQSSRLRNTLITNWNTPVQIHLF